jgi:hypothetical protein
MSKRNGVAGNLGFDKLVKERYISIRDVLMLDTPDTQRWYPLYKFSFV